MSGGKAVPPMSKRATSDSDVISRAEILREVRAVLDSNHFTPEQIDIFESLGYVSAQQLIAVVLNLVKEASVGSQLKPSPSRTSVIVTCNETFKKIMSPCDPDFFAPFRDTFKGVAIPEFWQHFRGPVLVSPEGHFGCAMCGVEAVVSSNGTSLLCPKRSQFPDAKKAQEQGCFFILKIRVAEITAEKQNDVLVYNHSKSANGTKKASDIAKEILATKRVKLDD